MVTNAIAQMLISQIRNADWQADLEKTFSKARIYYLSGHISKKEYEIICAEYVKQL